MTTFSDTFDKAAPAGGDDPSEADDNMRRIQAAVQERENVDHYWPLTGTEVSDEDAGEHRKVTLRVGDAPDAVANKGFVYAKDVSDKAELFYRDEDGNEKQITNAGKLNVVDADGAVVKTGIQTIAGVKTFSSSPIVPAPTTDLQAATKKYIDDLVSALAFGTRTTDDSLSNPLALNSIYKAGSDGFVTGFQTGGNGLLDVITDASSTPTTHVWNTQGGTGTLQGFCVPIKKDDYWQVTSAGSAIIFWLPIGSGESVKQ